MAPYDVTRTRRWPSTSAAAGGSAPNIRSVTSTRGVGGGRGDAVGVEVAAGRGQRTGRGAHAQALEGGAALGQRDLEQLGVVGERRGHVDVAVGHGEHLVAAGRPRRSRASHVGRRRSAERPGSGSAAASACCRRSAPRSAVPRRVVGDDGAQVARRVAGGEVGDGVDERGVDQPGQRAGLASAEVEQPGQPAVGTQRLLPARRRRRPSRRRRSAPAGGGGRRPRRRPGRPGSAAGRRAGRCAPGRRRPRRRAPSRWRRGRARRTSRRRRGSPRGTRRGR